MEYATLVELVREAMSAGMEAITLYLTVISAYLVVAFFAGSKLSSFQTFLSTTLMLIFSAFFTIGSFSFFSSAHGLSKSFGPELGFPTMPSAYAWVIACAQVLGVIGALIFMYHERKKNGDT